MEENCPSSPKEEPAPKKLKMSTTSTTTSGDDVADVDTITTTSPKKRRYKRRKIAMFFAYCGVGYQGMQKNPGAKTIEGDLEEALYHSGAVPEQDRGQPKRFDWARSARTDKGVSAVGQVVSGRFYVDPPGLVDRLNSNLPSQIRIFGYKRVTASFNAKKFCDRRRYVYLLPVFALDPSCHRDRESVLASLGSDNELAKCLECSERGRKVEGLMGKRSFVSKVQSGISSNSGAAMLTTTECNEIPDVSLGSSNECNLDSNENVSPCDTSVVISDCKVDSGISSNNGAAMLGAQCKEPNNSCSDNNDYGNLDSNENVGPTDGSAIISTCNVVLGMSSDNGAAMLTGDCKDQAKVSSGNEDEGTKLVSSKSIESGVENMVCEQQTLIRGERVEGELSGCWNGAEKAKKNEFGYGEKKKERFNRILKNYEGTHNFHNFTTRTKAEDPSARRYIVSFNANTTITVEGIEFVKCEVVGQSFMLHQIRKMIGLAVAILRNFAPESLFDKVFQQDFNINVPMAPEVGLYLDECLFTSYNNKWKDHEELSMRAYAEDAEDFKTKHIYSHIANTEHKDGVVGLWLHSLNHRNYPEFRALDGSATVEGNIAETQNVS